MEAILDVSSVPCLSYRVLFILNLLVLEYLQRLLHWHAFVHFSVMCTNLNICRFPMPTIALLNGHTFAGGLMLSMAHDYRLAPSPKGYLCLNEVLFGAPLKPPMAAIFRHKLSAPVYRTVALEAKRMSGADAVAMGLADGLCPNGLDDALALIDEKTLLDKCKAGVYGVIKAEMYNKLIKELDGAGLEQEEARFQATQERDAERQEFGKVWYEQWKKGSKL